MPVILHLIDSLGMGGAQCRLLNDIQHMNGTFRHRVVTLFDDSNLESEKPASLKMETSSLRMKRLSDLPVGIGRLTRLCRRENFQLIHTQLFSADVAGRITGRILGIPVVSTFQSAIYEPDSGLHSSWRRWVDEKSCRWVKQVIAVSQFVKGSLQRRLKISPEKITVIPNSVDTHQFSPSPLRRSQNRHRLDFQENDFSWITVGRLNAPKGYSTLLAAMEKLLGEGSPTRLLIVGEGPDRRWLEADSQKRGLGKQVHFLGAAADVRPFLDAADGFVFPSLSEGLPLALLEAMAMEKPCVASRIGPHEEMIEPEKSGLLFTPKDSAELSTAMARIQDDPSLAKQMGSQARLRVEKQFDAAFCARRLGELYDSLLKGDSA